MEQVVKIIKSKISPNSKNVLWDNGSDLMIYRNGKWDKAVKVMSIVHLSVCSSGTPEAALNLERLRRFSGDFFLCDITYGIGVGNFNNGAGGKAHITTPDGNEEYYIINVDGSVQTDESKKSLVERITALEEILL